MKYKLINYKVDIDEENDGRILQAQYLLEDQWGSKLNFLFDGNLYKTVPIENINDFASFLSQLKFEIGCNELSKEQLYISIEKFLVEK
ncbi:hypothetical protein [Floricoccus penangensis]|uniref:Uncharacterized protein n=1 Tax=Floricoccus penangensis TaxID=1859475 RepID=A0A9Q5NZX9_9LACT|nr:hypothetical protein [Floricoccus penangensis]OFI46867.1 hypothetical protein BG262_03485 [Floricoccus penangensis]URZ86629.1 hypothetical protein KIW23_05890 [Floricoccus penangensis]